MYVCMYVCMYVYMQIFTLCGFQETPQWFVEATQNKMAVFAAIFLANTMANSLTATGAFEVTLNGQTVFSKLDAGRMPTADDIIEGMARLGITN